MKWWRWVEVQLREYHYRFMYREDIEQEREFDDEVSVPTSSISGMPRRSGFTESALERQVLNREEAEENRRKRLQVIQQHEERIEQVLGYLEPVERQIIESTYFTLLNEQAIADKANNPVVECRRIRKQAMKKIYLFFRGEWPPNVEPIFMTRPVNRSW